MNYSLYLFGTNKGRYIQYPYDGEESILKPLCTSVKNVQMTVCRQGSLVRYVYIRQLSLNPSQVFGICLIINGAYTKDIKVLYSTFDRIFTQVVLNGRILNLSGTGKIFYSSDDFASDKHAVEHAQTIIQDVVDQDLKSNIVHSRFNFSGRIATKLIALEEKNSDILRTIEQYNVVHIFQKENASSVISYVEQTISKLYKENSKLRAEYSKLKAQKKQYRNVLLLFFIVLCCSAGIYYLYRHLNNTQWNLYEANSRISEKNSEIVDKNNEIVFLSYSIDSIQNKYETDVSWLNYSKDSLKSEYDKRLSLQESSNAILRSKYEKKISSLDKTIISLQRDYCNEQTKNAALEEKLSYIYKANPFVVTNCSVSRTAFSFEYLANESQTVSVTLKAINEKKNEIVSSTYSITINNGGGSIRLEFNHALKTSAYYYAVLIYDNRIVAGKRW